MQATMSKMVNGVDVTAMFEAVDHIRRDPCLAAFNFRVRNRWMGGGLNQTTISDFSGVGTEHQHETGFVVYNDEPPVLLSGDKGPNPVENLLHALAGCMTTGIVYHAAAKGIEIRSITSRFEGDLDLRGFLGMDPTVRSGYEQIRVTFTVDADATPEEIEEIVSAGPRYSPVFDVVTNGTPVKVTAEKA